MMKTRRQLLTEQERIRRIVFRRRRMAEKAALLRAQRMGAPRAVLITYEEIRERDGEHCYLCGLFLSVHDMSFEHVQPLSDGGEHTPENVRLAHRVCNSKKGVRPLSDLDLSEF